MKKNLNFTLILGSKSSRRQNLLNQAGLDFKIAEIDCNEDFPDLLDIRHIAKFLAEKKSKAYTNKLSEGEILLTADTIVLLNDNILGKPSDNKEAKKMLQLISGKTHEVITGVCLRSKDKTISFDDTTIVSFLELTEDEIEYYISTDSPLDKAGAYGIQDWIGLIGIDTIQGSYYNVVGLPIHKVYQELNRF